MYRVLVVNAKGGCGKTTLATNLASYYASRDQITTLIDYDPQGSSIRWLGRRPADSPVIHGIAAFETKRTDVTRTWQLRLPPQTERVVVDAPAGLNGVEVADYVRQADFILIPVLPSPIDIHATAHFIQDLLLAGKARAQNKKLAVVANRIRENTRIYRSLERFLNTLHLPFVARLRDTQNYVTAVQDGIGIHELRPSRAKRDREQWAPLIAWLEHGGRLPEIRNVTHISHYAYK